MNASLILLIGLALGIGPVPRAEDHSPKGRTVNIGHHSQSRLNTRKLQLKHSARIPRGRLPKTSEAPSEAVAPPPQCILGGHTYITPCSANDSIGGSLSKTLAFTVFNTGGVSDEYELTCQVVSPASSCFVSPGLSIISASGSRNVNVTVGLNGGTGTGRVTLKAKSTVNSDSATGIVDLFGTRRAPVLSTEPHDGKFVRVPSCAVQCFDATASFTTPAYVSRDTPRSVTLLYNSARAANKGVIQVNVTDTSGAPPNTISIRLKRGAGWVTLSNGLSEIFYRGGSGVSRLAAQFDMSVGTWIHADTVYVRSTWTSDNLQKEVKTPIETPTLGQPAFFGSGWWIAGFQALVVSNGQLMISDGDASIVIFDSYSCSSVCIHTSLVDVSVVQDVGTGPVRYLRQYPDSSKVAFDSAGNMVYSEDRFGSRTTFGYTGLGGGLRALTSITDPAGKAITLFYNGGGRVDSIGGPGGRRIAFEYEYTGGWPLIAIYGPDYNGSNGSTTRLARFYYDASERMTRRVDARGKEWAYAYDAIGKLAADTAPKILIGVDSVRPVTLYSAPQRMILAGADTGTSTKPFVRVIPDSIKGTVTDPEGHVTRYWINRYGQPTRVSDPLGRITAITYDKLRPSVITAPNLSQETFTYTGAYLSSSWKTGDLTIYYTYDSAGRLTQASGPGRPTTNYYYDSIGRDSVTKV